jgi:hypothetical protein
LQCFWGLFLGFEDNLVVVTASRGFRLLISANNTQLVDFPLDYPSRRFWGDLVGSSVLDVTPYSVTESVYNSYIVEHMRAHVWYGNGGWSIFPALNDLVKS